MSALVIRLPVVRLAVDQSARLGMPETRRDVVARVVADIKAGHHPYVPDIGALERIQGAGRRPVQAGRS